MTRSNALPWSAALSDPPLAALIWLISAPERRGPCPVSSLPPDDCDRLAELAIRRHRVAPAVAAALDDLPFAAPGHLRERLESAARSNSLAALTQKAETRRLLAAMEAEGVPVLLLKGWPLGEELYGSAALRHAKDIDILVAPEDVARAERVLEAAGYAGDRAAAEGRGRKEASFLNPAAGTEVELHWRAFNHRRLPGLAPAAAGLRRWCGGGWSVPIPGAERNLIYLALHGGEHGWERLKWLLDIRHWLGTRTALEAGAMLAAARRDGAVRAVAVALRLAHGLLAAPLPAGLPPPGPRERRLLRLAEEAIRSGPTAVRDRPARIRQVRFKLGLCEGPRQILPALGYEISAWLRRPGAATGRPTARGIWERIVLSGFPWPMPQGAGVSEEMLRVNAAARRVRLARWPLLLRPPAAVCMALAWPFGAAWMAWRSSGRSRFPGRPRAATALALWALALRCNRLPMDVAVRRLSARSAEAAPQGDWFGRRDEKTLRHRITPARVVALMADKAAFARFCEREGIPHPPLLEVWRGGRRDGPGRDLPAEALVLKPVSGQSSRGIEFWLPAAGGWERDGTRLDAAGLEARLAALSRTCDMLVQPSLAPHPRSPGLAVVRVLAGRGREAAAEVVLASVSDPGTPHAGSREAVARAVDPSSGRVLPLTANQREKIALGWMQRENPPWPDDAVLPFWDEAAAAVRRGHDALPDPTPFAIWEVAIAAEGAVVIEANASWDVGLFQEMHGRPVTRGRFLEILLEHLP